MSNSINDITLHFISFYFGQIGGGQTDYGKFHYHFFVNEGFPYWFKLFPKV